jgi:molybdopterin synthase sulfur carrier subunit
MIKVVFFAALREQLGCESITLAADGIKTINQVKQALVAQHPDWQSFIENNALLSAVNHDMVGGETLVKTGDEVAFFPPVTGG